MFESVNFSSLPQDAHSVRYSGESLNLYQRLIQYFGVVSDVKGTYLDIINFNRDVYPSVLSLKESEEIFSPEHGYACPDGSVEMYQLIERYETARTQRFINFTGSPTTYQNSTQTSVGLGNGATGVMNCLIPAIRDYWFARASNKQPSVVVTLPLYSVYDGIVGEHGLQPLYLQTTLENKFLPLVSELEELFKSNPMAVILTFPTNPAQTTYCLENIGELQKIVELCQATETFLLVDNVYQDTLWESESPNPEIFGLTSSPDFLIKIFSPSKDRPGFSGLRVGYWYGDSRLHERYFYYSSIQYNTPNSASRCLFALDLLFRLLDIEGRPLALADLDLWSDHLAGWNRTLNRKIIFERMIADRLQEKYQSRLQQIEAMQRQVNSGLMDLIRSLKVFSDVVNDNIGNVLLLRINPEYFAGTDHELFLYLLKNVGIGVLPANAFGFPLMSRNAWFRITTIHAKEEQIVSQLETVAKSLS